MARGDIRIDTSGWPVVHVTFVGELEDAAFTRYLEAMDGLLARPGQRALIYDASQTGGIPASLRKRKTDWLAHNRLRIAQCTLGLAFVLPNALVRGALTAILWVVPMPAPHVVVASVEQAREACDRWLDDAPGDTVI